jgi:hypothetical protein
VAAEAAVELGTAVEGRSMEMRAVEMWSAAVGKEMGAGAKNPKAGESGGCFGLFSVGGG